MSSYINFYLKTKKGEWCPIDSFSRNNAIYEYGNNYVAYDKGTPLTAALLNEIIDDIRNENKNYEDTIKKYRERKTLVASMNNSIEEKMEEICNIDGYIEEVEEIHKELDWAESFYCVLRNMVNEAESTKYYSNPDRHLDPSDYIYAGVEWSPYYSEEE